MARFTLTNDKSKLSQPNLDSPASGSNPQAKDAGSQDDPPVPAFFVQSTGNSKSGFMIKLLLNSLLILVITFLSGGAIPDRRGNDLGVEVALALDRFGADADRELQGASLRIWDWIHGKSEASFEFANAALSWKGKWYSIQPWLPGGNEQSARDFLNELFQSHFFSSSDLQTTLQNEIISTQMIWNALETKFYLENSWLLNSSEAIIDLDESSSFSDASSGQLDPAAHQHGPNLDGILNENQSTTLKSAGRLIASEITTEIAARVLARMGISLGILSTGASSSVYTFGVGAILGLVVDQCYSWIQNPEGRLEREIKGALERLANEVAISFRETMRQELNGRVRELEKLARSMVSSGDFGK